jgi:hypothetical protein
MFISTLEIHFLFFKNEFREGTYTPMWGVRGITSSSEIRRSEFHLAMSAMVLGCGYISQVLTNVVSAAAPIFSSAEWR